MDKNQFNFPVHFEIDSNYKDERFLKVKVWLMHLGENLNGSYFSKEVVEDGRDTLGYIPIVGFIEENSLGKDDFSDHRFKITKTKDGVEYTYLGIAYGVILSNEDNNSKFEMRLCDDGVEREFLVVEGLLWRQFKGADILAENMSKAQSMELFGDNCEGEFDENGIYHFTKISFLASCILGADFQPAMQNSTVEVQFTAKDFVVEIQREIKNMVKQFSLEKEKDKTKEGNDLGIQEKNSNFSLTTMQLYEEISNIVKGFEKVEDDWGYKYSRYYLTDVQDNEAIIVDRKENYNYYGVSFSVNEDKVEIDFGTKKRKKVIYSDMDVSTEEGSVVTNYVFNILSEIYENANSKISNIEASFSEIKEKFDDYVAKEKEALEEKSKNEKAEIFSKFDSSLKDSDEYKDIKSKQNEFSVDEIKSKCAIIYTELTMNNFTLTEGAESGIPQVSIVENNTDNSVIISDRYGTIKKNI